MLLRISYRSFPKSVASNISRFLFFSLISIGVKGQSSTPETIKVICKPCSLKDKVYTLTPEKLDLKKGQAYVFSFEKLNPAYYNAEINAQSLKKTFDLPAVLQTIIPTLSTSQRSNIAKYPSINTASLPPVYAEVTKDYDVLNTILKEGDNLVKKIPDDLTPSVSVALGIATFSEVRNALASSGLSFFTSTDLDNIKKAKYGTDLQPYLNSVLIDFQAGCSLIKKSTPLNLDLSALTIFKYCDYVELNKGFIENICNAITIVQNANNSIESEPYQITGDYLRVNVNLFGNRFSGNPDTLLQTQIDFYRVHYFQFDISSGFFLNNLVSKSYYYTDTLKNYKSESSRTIDLSVGALLHFNYVFTSAIKTGPVLGAGVSFLDGKVRYFGGWGIMIGRNNEFALSVGAALSSLPVPSNAINTSEFGPSSPSSSVPTYDKLNWKGFIGITYCFTNKSK